MGRIERFEDIRAWQKARELTNAVYRSTSDGSFSQDYLLKNQIRKAVVSAVSNIAEGFERDGSREFINFLSIAKGSVGEVHAQLYVAHDLNYISDDEFDNLSNLTTETGKLIGAFIKHLKGSALKGHKFQILTEGK